jgi:nitric oxide synthase oxygenase domain/subunit
MSNLTELYITMESLRKLNLTIDEKLKNEAALLEEDLIRKEILPMLIEKIEPALKQVQRELVLVVDYVPGEDLKVHLSRKRNLADALTDAVEIKLDPTVEHKSFGKQKAKKGEIASATRLRVTMPDGKVIAESKAAETLRKVIEQIGAERVRALGLTWCKVPFISNTKDPKYGHAQHPVGNGWYVITHSGTKDKKKVLDKIAKALHLNLKVDIID